MVGTFLEGFLLQASLILALGAQNLFVIDISLKKNNHLLAAAVCAVCDFILIFVGVLGVSALIIQSIFFKVVIGTLGTLFLLYYAIIKLREYFYPHKIKSKPSIGRLTKKKVLLTALSFTLLNPHVYIDTFFLVGGYSAQIEGQAMKTIFGVGAGTFSVVWFYSLAIFSSLFSKSLSKESNARKLNLLTGIILGFLAFKMGVDLYQEVLKL